MRKKNSVHRFFGLYIAFFPQQKHFWTRTRFCGLPVGDPKLSMALTTFLLLLSFTRPKTTCAPSNLKRVEKVGEIVLQIPFYCIPGCFDGGDEELRTIGIFATVCHRYGKFLVFQLKVFIREF